MYNLFVSEWDDEWKGEPCVLDASRCVRDHEYTDEKIADHYGALDETALKKLTRLPSIFAYEAACRQDPTFGIIREVTVRRGQVRIEYEIIPVHLFLVAADVDALSFELDIGNWEMNRTHWAVKDVICLKNCMPRVAPRCRHGLGRRDGPWTSRSTFSPSDYRR